MFSSIPIEKRSEVIDKCYWPLLNIIKKYQLPIGIEASAITLEIINKIDKSWIVAFKSCIKDNLCELIGSGYAQIIGPLVPSLVNQKNLELGDKRYLDLINVKPSIALINEQAYSSGLIEIYINNGYKAIIMEWENPYKFNTNWGNKLKYKPQKIRDSKNNEIFLIWNQSTCFQQFQRYAHSEIEMNDYLEFLNKHVGAEKRYIPFYGGDAEIFDFRPGRYKTESQLSIDKEWLRIEELIVYLKESQKYKFTSVSSLINLDITETKNSIKLENPKQPIPVKKQNKYNILRWANTGRDDLKINTRCQKIFDYLEKNNIKNDHDWKELCYFWSSDFRTHINKNRWNNYLEKLMSFEKKYNIKEFTENVKVKENPIIKKSKKINIVKEKKFLIIQSEDVSITFNTAKGLTLHSYIDKNISEESIIGTLSHGYFEDISWIADFYTGHLTLEIPGQPKYTDLSADFDFQVQEKDHIIIKMDSKESIYSISKIWTLDFNKKFIRLELKIKSFKAILGSLRVGYITLNPDLFDNNSLLISTKNGGNHFEDFKLSNQNIDLGNPVSFLVSANNAFGMTDGRLSIRDRKIIIDTKVDITKANVVALLVHKKVDSKWFTRIIFSALEFDDTSKPLFVNLDFKLDIRINKIIDS